MPNILTAVMNIGGFLVKYFAIAVTLSCLSCNTLIAQFHVLRNATESSYRCWTLTPDQPNQVGAVWYNQKFDLSQSFDLTASLFLGCDKNGSNGMLFGLQPIAEDVGEAGPSMGMEGIMPSLAVEFDTHKDVSFNDPGFDHVAIVQNGDMNHNNRQNTLSGPIGISKSPAIPPANLKDCKTHEVRFTWDAPTHKLSVFWDCISVLSLSNDIVNTIFKGNPNVYWGFTATSGDVSNVQRVCIEYASMIDKLVDTSFCVGGSVPLVVNGGIKYSWTPTAGLTDPTIRNPIAQPEKTTKYTAQITNACNVNFFESINVHVGKEPFSFKLGNDTVLCTGQTVLLKPELPGATFLWQNKFKDSTFLVSKSGVVKVTAERDYCKVTDSLKVRFIDPPMFDLGGSGIICNGTKKILTVKATDASFKWQDGSDLNSYVITQPGMYTVTVKNSCGTTSDSYIADYQQCHQVYIPTAFSPNGDGQNDLWSVYGGDDISKIISIRVFNRWGNLVFGGNDLEPGAIESQWDGDKAANGLYTYYVTVAYTDGDSETFTGSVAIVR